MSDENDGDRSAGGPRLRDPSSNAQLIPDTCFLVEITQDEDVSKASWTPIASVYSGVGEQPETWNVDKVAVADLASAVAVRISQVLSTTTMSNSLAETTPRNVTWQSSTDPTYPSGYTFAGTYHYNATQSGTLAITFALGAVSGGMEITTTTWFNPDDNLIDLQYNTDKVIVMTLVGGSGYSGSVYKATSTYST